MIDYLAYIPAATSVWLSRVLPLMGRRLLARSLGIVMYLATRANGKRYAEINKNIRVSLPDMDAKERSSLIWRCCRHWGFFLVQGFRIPKYSRETIGEIVEFEGLEHLDAAHKRGKGVLLAWGHFGQWDMVYNALTMLDYPVRVVVRRQSNPHIDKMLEQLRLDVGVITIWRENAARSIMREIRGGNIVALMFDQNAAFNNIFVPFFGRPGATFMTPGVMARRTGCAVLPVNVYRDGIDEKFRLCIGPEVTLDKNLEGDTAIRAMMLELNRRLEEAIRQTPEQWLWLHRRWKTEPDAEELAEMEADLKLIAKAADSS